MLFLLKIKWLILDILFPPICLNCKKTLEGSEKDTGICALCLSKIIIHTTLFCPTCRARLPENKKVCHLDSSYLLAATTNYQDEVKNLIHQLKYQSWTRLEKPIRCLVETYLKNLASQFKNYLVVPIPLHKTRQRERGFNQAELIGKIISENLNLPLEKNILTRTKETKSQTDFKDWEQRKNNLVGAFRVIRPEAVAGKNIILVDDVYTSGATINEAIKILRLSDAKKIIAFVLAKTR